MIAAIFLKSICTREDFVPSQEIGVGAAGDRRWALQGIERGRIEIVERWTASTPTSMRNVDREDPP
jgi:hypothetical protein